MFTTSEKLSSEMEGFFVSPFGNILATNHMFFASITKTIKLLRHSYPKHRGMGFRKRFFY
jgi:hypothetical protein